jgi:hypothetical protein
VGQNRKLISEVTIFRALWHLGSICRLIQQALFSTYLYLAFKHGLVRQIDSNLKTTAIEIKDIIIEKNQQFKLDYKKSNH